MKIEKIAVFCGANTGNASAYTEAAQELAAAFAQKGIGLIYGGGKVGMMGIIADAMLHYQQQVIGVIPQFLVDKELAHPNVTSLKIVDSMHQRKAYMAEQADGFILLPGGIGSLEEFFEIFTWSQLGLHNKPCGLLNTNGYYDALISLLENTVNAGFLEAIHFNKLIIENSALELIDKFESYQAISRFRHIDNMEQT